MAGFNGLSFTVQPVITSAGVLNTAGIVAGTSLIAGILDPTSTDRIFNPVAEGNPVASGDAASKWLPVVSTGYPTATTVADNYWTPVFNGVTFDSDSAVGLGQSKFGQVQLFLTPAAANTVEASSVLHFYLSPNALVLVATGTF